MTNVLKNAASEMRNAIMPHCGASSPRYGAIGGGCGCVVSADSEARRDSITSMLSQKRTNHRVTENTEKPQ